MHCRRSELKRESAYRRLVSGRKTRTLGKQRLRRPSGSLFCCCWLTRRCYYRTMADLPRKAFGGLLWLFVAMTMTIFGAAGTVNYWQAWLYLTVFFASTIVMTLDLAKNDPQLLARRSTGGPFAEGTTTQKIIMSFASLGFIALLVVPALDRRFAWSSMPGFVSIAGDIVFVLSYLAIMHVFHENTFAASTIAVEPGQRVISTGAYTYVRHPMYAAGLVLLGASPIALGSGWGLLVFIPLIPVLVWRLLDEEIFLTRNLIGYAENCERVKYRLMPFVW